AVQRFADEDLGVAVSVHVADVGDRITELGAEGFTYCRRQDGAVLSRVDIEESVRAKSPGCADENVTVAVRVPVNVTVETSSHVVTRWGIGPPIEKVAVYTGIDEDDAAVLNWIVVLRGDCVVRRTIGVDITDPRDSGTEVVVLLLAIVRSDQCS